MNTQSKHYAWSIAVILAVFVLLVYLGVRTIRHEALLAQSHIDQVAQSRLDTVEDFLSNLLKQKASRLDAIAGHIELNAAALKHLTDKDTDIEQVFILDQGKLIYPPLDQGISQKERAFIDEIAPVVDDPSILFAHSIDSEKTMPNSGWFLGNTPQGPLLIYWRNRDGLTIGFRVSYVKLLSDVINNANFSYTDGHVEIWEHDRKLYRSELIESTKFVTDINSSDMQQLGLRYLNYPLNGWQIRYESQPANLTRIYLLGAALMSILLAGIALLLYRIYREYSQTRRDAMQQVNFVSQVSHELKTPLTNITLYAELLQEELADQDHPENTHSVDVIISESRRLSRLIQNILSFTRPSKVNIQTVDVSELMAQIAQTFKPLFAVKSVELVLDIGEGISLKTDRDRVSQIICNFLSNAEKYAASGKRVDLHVRQHAEHVDIEVRDYGSGIPTAEQEKIFKPFYRIHSSITEGVSGTGIGLAISKQLADSIGSEILLRHQEPGACFTLRLWGHPKHEPKNTETSSA
ncbi:MAG: sensor histidine kinase [Saezia sp.]